MARARSIRDEGFTLVELMVALALSALISVSIMFISSQARLAYDGTVKKVDVYNRFRFAFKALEGDIRNWIPTSELEFYTDGRGRGAKVNAHWDPGEEVPDRSDAKGFGVVDGGEIGDYDEYATITELQYKSREPFSGEDKIHDCFQLYFRTLTFVNGQIRVANVEYMLVDPNFVKNNDGQLPPAPAKGGARKVDPPPRQVKPENVQNLSLVKIVRYLEISYENIDKVNLTPVKREVIEVSSNVTDFSIEYAVDRDFRGRVSPEFRRPSQDFAQPSEIATRPKHIPGMGLPNVGAYRKTFGYGTVKLGEKMQLAVAFPARQGDDQLAKGGGGGGEHTPVRVGFQGNQEISFAELTPGDKIFCFLGSSRGEGGQGAAAQSAGNATKFIRFPDADYTVKTNLDGLLEFDEDIDSTDWNGQTKSSIYYKAAFMPAGVRIKLRIVDDKGENPKTLEKEVWLRRRSR